jgi:hypothetical protein
MINNKSLIQKSIKKYLEKYKKYENPENYCVFSIYNSNNDNSNNDKNFIEAIKNHSKSNEILIPDIYKLKRCSSAKFENKIKDSYVKSPLSCNKELLKIINKINKKKYDNKVNLILKAQKNLKLKKIYENYQNDKKDNFDLLPYLLKKENNINLNNSKSEKKLTPYLKIKKFKDFQKLKIEQKIKRNNNDKLFSKFCLFNSHSQKLINSSLNSNNFLSKNSQKNDSKKKISSNNNLISLKKEQDLNDDKSFFLYNHKNDKIYNNNHKIKFNNNIKIKKEENKFNQINISNNSKYNLNFTNESFHKIKKIGIKQKIYIKKQSKLINTNIEIKSSNDINNNSNKKSNEKNNKNELNNIILNNNNTPLMNNLLTKVIKLKSGENIQENLYNIY